jgi:hypothetical protein
LNVKKSLESFLGAERRQRLDVKYTILGDRTLDFCLYKPSLRLVMVNHCYVRFSRHKFKLIHFKDSSPI